MPSKREKIAIGEYCHVYNRGVDKRVIFTEENHVERFIESMCIFNDVCPTVSLSDKKKTLRAAQQGVRPLAEPLVEIVAYSLLPNHFHILIKQIRDGGVSEFMKRLQCGYTNYFNIENKRSGVLFQGKYKCKHVPTDEYLKTIFSYVTFNSHVHNIPKDISHLTSSSLNEYVTKSPQLVASNQIEFIFKIFDNNINKLKKHGLEIASIIKEKRNIKESKADNMFLE